MTEQINVDEDLSHNPCNGACVADPKWGEYCLGCKRFVMEIMNWEYYSNKEKTQINRRIQDLLREDPNDYPYK